MCFLLRAKVVRNPNATVRTWSHVSRTVSANHYGPRVLRITKQTSAASSAPVQNEADIPTLEVPPDDFRELMR